MNVYSIENGEIAVEYSNDEPNRTGNNQKGKNTAENLSDNEEIPVFIIKKKIKPMNPTPS